MTKETMVHVKTIEQWKSVLDVWFAQGHKWIFKTQEYFEYPFKRGSRFLVLQDNKIWHSQTSQDVDVIEYADFMEQQEKTMAKETYYVTQEQLDWIEIVRKSEFPIYDLIMMSGFRKLVRGFKPKEDKDLLKYLGGDTSIEFKVKEQLYRLWRIDDGANRVYAN